MRVLDLFAGIGGFSLAAHWIGWETIGFIEIDPFCQKVLAKNFPNVPIFGDIKEFDGTQYNGAVDIITGGIPCQPFSSAGKRLGEADERHLWEYMFGNIETIQPSYVVVENVVGITNLEGGGTLRRIRTDLENIGYEVECFDMPAYVVGLQTLERHIWIVATSTRKRLKRRKAKQDQDNRNEGQFSGTDTGINRRWNISETRFCDVAERVSRRLAGHQREQLKAAGNAIPPQVVHEIFKAINQLNSKPCTE